MPQYLPWSGGKISSARHQDGRMLLPGKLNNLPLQSAQSLETKDIQEFLLAVSDFLKSAELVSHGGKSK
jgi:hypothetical protein